MVLQQLVFAVLSSCEIVLGLPCLFFFLLCQFAAANMPAVEEQAIWKRSSPWTVTWQVFCSVRTSLYGRKPCSQLRR